MKSYINENKEFLKEVKIINDKELNYKIIYEKYGEINLNVEEDEKIEEFEENEESYEDYDAIEESLLKKPSKYYD